MSTRSYIIVKVPRELIGTEIKFDASKLPVKVGKMNWDKGEVIEQPAAHRDPINLEHEYIRIYHHNDGYPTGLGANLLKNFNSLDAALNLVAGGACDTCLQHYMGWAEYGWKASDYHDESWQTDTPVPDEEYSYMWADGRWVYYNWSYDKMKKFHDLKAAVIRAWKKEHQDINRISL